MTEELKHYGVKGMKWGVRKSTKKSSSKRKKRGSRKKSVKKAYKKVASKTMKLSVSTVKKMAMVASGTLWVVSALAGNFGMMTASTVVDGALRTINAVDAMSSLVANKDNQEQK